MSTAKPNLNLLILRETFPFSGCLQQRATPPEGTACGFPSEVSSEPPHPPSLTACLLFVISRESRGLLHICVFLAANDPSAAAFSYFPKAAGFQPSLLHLDSFGFGALDALTDFIPLPRPASLPVCII